MWCPSRLNTILKQPVYRPSYNQSHGGGAPKPSAIRNPHQMGDQTPWGTDVGLASPDPGAARTETGGDRGGPYRGPPGNPRPPLRTRPWPFTNSRCARLTPPAKPGKYEDGGGLRLVVSPTGAKKWVPALRYASQGKRREMGLGQLFLPVSGCRVLADARCPGAARSPRRQVATGGGGPEASMAAPDGSVRKLGPETHQAVDPAIWFTTCAARSAISEPIGTAGRMPSIRGNGSGR